MGVLAYSYVIYVYVCDAADSPRIICICVYIYVCDAADSPRIICVYIYVCGATDSPRIICICIYVCDAADSPRIIYMYVYVYVCVYIYVCVHICICVWDLQILSLNHKILDRIMWTTNFELWTFTCSWIYRGILSHPYFMWPISSLWMPFLSIPPPSAYC